MRKSSLFEKNRIIPIVLSVILAGLLAGCGSAAEKDAGAAPEPNEPVENKEMTDPWNDMPADAHATEEVSSEPEPNEQPADGALTPGELSEYEDAFNSSAYNGFLTQEFTGPETIWWDEVFYNGAGLEAAPYDYESIVASYQQKTGEEELFGDLTYVGKKEKEEYIMTTTGLDESRMKHPLDWMYLEDQDVYAYEHGDTNFIPIKVLEGIRSGDTVTLRYISEGYSESPDAPEFEVVFEDNGNGYVFKSNLWAPEEGREAGIKKIYDNILKKYAIAVSERWDGDRLKEAVMCTKPADLYNEKGFDSDPMEMIGYYYRDIDDDGIDELFIGVNRGDYIDTIYEVYSVMRGSWDRVFMAYDESLYYLCDDNTFYNEEIFEGGVRNLIHDEVYGPYRFLRTIDAVRDEDGSLSYSDDNFWKNIRVITRSEYDDYVEKAASSYVNIAYTPLSTIDIGSEGPNTSNADQGDAVGVYTDEELCKMALDYYERQTGYRPGIAAVDGTDGDIVTLHLYDDMGDHTATSAWYEIDRNTATGEDIIMGESVDLK